MWASLGVVGAVLGQERTGFVQGGSFRERQLLAQGAMEALSDTLPLAEQRGFPRPGPDGSYDIGAVERQPSDVDVIPRLDLPLIKR